MNRELLISLLPYLAAIVGSLLVLRGLVWLSGARWKFTHLAGLHRDQQGSVQSLSFVLTLPVFILIMMFIVQLSQIVIAKMVVQYAAFAAARSAVVWIPANLGPGQEMENQIGAYQYLADWRDENGVLFHIYQVAPDGPKFSKVHLAAAMACMPLAPTRKMAVAGAHPGNAALPSIRKAYRGVSPASARNPQIATRLANKLAYSLENTNIRIEIRHKDEEPPLKQHFVPPYLDEYAPNEIAWHDQVIVTVAHDFALLPGPASMMSIPGNTSSGSNSGGPGSDSSIIAPTSSPGDSGFSGQTYGGGLSSSYGSSRPMASGGRVFTKRITATVRLNTEGEKPVLPYVQRLNGVPASEMSPGDVPSTPSSGTSPGETGSPGIGS